MSTTKITGFSKYPSCGGTQLTVTFSSWITNLKTHPCKTVVKCPIGETAGTGTEVELLAKYPPKKDFSIHFRKSHIFTHSKSHIIYYLDLFQCLIWLQILSRGANTNAISHFSWLSQNEVVWGWGPRSVLTAAAPPTTRGWSECDLSQGPRCKSAGQESLSPCSWRDWIWHLPTEVRACVDQQRAFPVCVEGANVLQLFNTYESQSIYFGAWIEVGF